MTRYVAKADTIADLAQDWLADLRNAGRSPRTLARMSITRRPALTTGPDPGGGCWFPAHAWRPRMPALLSNVTHAASSRVVAVCVVAVAAAYLAPMIVLVAAAITALASKDAARRNSALALVRLLRCAAGAGTGTTRRRPGSRSPSARRWSIQATGAIVQAA